MGANLRSSVRKSFLSGDDARGQTLAPVTIRVPAVRDVWLHAQTRGSYL